MYSVQRGLRSENFLVSRDLVKRLVRDSSITSQDTVLEVGAGTGILTQELLHAAREVIACEIDPRLIAALHTRFKGAGNLRLFQQDFLALPLPQAPYKVFANIPFAMTGEVVRKLLQAAQPPWTAIWLSSKKPLASSPLGRGRTRWPRCCTTRGGPSRSHTDSAAPTSPPTPCGLRPDALPAQTHPPHPSEPESRVLRLDCLSLHARRSRQICPSVPVVKVVRR